LFGAQAGDDHQDDQNPDHVGNDVEKRIAAERFAVVALLAGHLEFSGSLASGTNGGPAKE